MLLTARPAAGKTTLLNQVIIHCLDSSTELVPILIKIQLLQTHLLEASDSFASAWNWVDAYLKRVEEPAVYRMLRQSMVARRSLILLDGLDEGGEKREEIERHVTEVLMPQGHVLLATSRPDGIDASRFGRFYQLSLVPLTDAQQLQALERRLGSGGVRELRPHLERMPIDEATQQRITSNPLMLSMVASIFELRTGLAMPETTVQLYAEATRAMLARVGEQRVALVLTPLVQAVFFEAHVAGQRVITASHLDIAAHRVADERGRGVLREAVEMDRMPLLSLLQTRPLQLQAAHLSFQEYFAARAICEGAELPRRPWLLPVWWANAVKLGLEMGDAFGRGLLGAGGKMLKDSSVRLTIGGHRPTAACALGAALRSATHINKVRVGRFDMQLDRLRRGGSLDLSGSKVGDLDLMVLAGFLTLAVADGIKLHTLKLARTRVGREGVLPLVRIPSLTRLDISGNKSFRAAGMRALGNELLASGTSRLGSLKCDAFDVPESATELKLSGLESGAVVLLAGVVKLNVSIEEVHGTSQTSHTLVSLCAEWCVQIQVNLDGLSLPIKKLKGSDPVASLDFSRKGLSSASAIVIACLIRDNASVTRLDVRGNNISDDGASQLSAAVLGNQKMEVFNEIPIKEMRTNSLIEIDLSAKYFGVVGGMVVAGLLPVMASVTSVRALGNSWSSRE